MQREKSATPSDQPSETEKQGTNEKMKVTPARNNVRTVQDCARGGGSHDEEGDGTMSNAAYRGYDLTGSLEQVD